MSNPKNQHSSEDGAKLGEHCFTEDFGLGSRSSGSQRCAVKHWQWNRESLVFTAIFGCSGGKWSTAADSEDGSLFSDRVSEEASGTVGCSALESLDARTCFITGFAIFKAWSALDTLPTDFFKCAMLRSLVSCRKSCKPVDVGFLKHEIFAAFSFLNHQCIQLPESYAVDLDVFIGSKIIEHCGNEKIQCSLKSSQFSLFHQGQGRAGDLTVKGLHQALQKSSIKQFFWNSCECFPLRYWFPFGILVANGKIDCDFSMFLKKNTVKCSEDNQLPVIVTKSAISRIRKNHMWTVDTLVQELSKVPDPLSFIVHRRRSSSCARQKWDPLHLIDYLDLDRDCKSQKHTAHAMKKAAKCRGEEADAIENMELPLGKSALGALGRIRLDAVAALLWRRFHGGSGPKFRYIAFDKSPLADGSECLNIVESIIARADVGTANLDMSRYVRRKMIPQFMDPGSCSASDIQCKLIRSFYLEYGPKTSDIKTAFDEVLQVLTDFGTEYDVASLDCDIDQWLSGNSAMPYRKPMCPFALRTPGPLHINDSIMTRSTQNLYWFSEWEGVAKKILQFLHSRRRRRALQRHFKNYAFNADLHDELSKSLAKTPEKFAKWRWRTLKRVLKSLETLRPALSTCCSVMTLDAMETLLGGREGECKLLRDTAQDDVFWHRQRILKTLFDPLFALTEWIPNCKCCRRAEGEPLRLEQCAWKGLRAPEMRVRLDVLRNEYLQSQQIIGASPLPGIEPAALSSLLAKVIALIDIKYKWVSSCPFLIVEALSPGGAKRFLDAADAMVSAGKTLDHITALFAGSDPASFRGEMETLASTGHLPDGSLCLKFLIGYSLCCMDDTIQESPHKDMKHHGTGKTFALPSYFAATYRMQQNMDFIHSVRNVHPDIVRDYWRQWRQLQPLKVHKALTKCKSEKKTWKYQLSSAEFKNFMYSMGDCEHERAYRMSKHFLKNSEETRLISIEMKIDFMQRVLDEGNVYSFPVVDSKEMETRGEKLKDLSAVALLSESLSSGCKFFRVCEACPKRFRVTDQECRHKSSMYVQFFKENGSEGDYPRYLYDVMPDGQPVEVSAFDISSWSVLRTSLRKWQCSESELAGHLRLSGGNLIAATDWNLQDSSTPALIIFEELVSRGYRPGYIRAHCRGSDKVIEECDWVSRKAYLQCLLKLDQCFRKGMKTLRTDQQILYYEAVRLSNQPQTVLEKQPLKYYKNLLSEMSGGSQLALMDQEDQPPPLAIEDLPTEEFALASRCGSSVNAGVKRGAKRKQCKIQMDYHLLGWAPAASLPISDSLAGRAESVADEPAQASTDVGSMQRALADAPRENRILPCGLRYSVEEHLTAGQPGHYVKCIVKCPECGGKHHDPKHDCHKSRNLSSEHTLVFGEAEVLGFLGVWAASSEKFRTRVGHMRHCTPTIAEIRQYLIQWNALPARPDASGS